MKVMLKPERCYRFLYKKITIFHTAECTFGVYTLHLLHYNFGFHMKKNEKNFTCASSNSNQY